MATQSGPLNPSAAEWIFFDVGTTLTDETPAHSARIRALSKLIPSEPAYSESELMRRQAEFARNGAESPYQSLLKSLRLPADLLSTIESRVTFDRNLEQPFPGARGVLERVSRCFKLGVIANQPSGLEKRLARHSLDRFFDRVIVSADVGFEKPDKRIFAMALELVQCRASAAVMVGDRLDNDIVPAQDLGMQTIWVRQGWRNDGAQLPAERTWNAVASQITEVPHLLGL